MWRDNLILSRWIGLINGLFIITSSGICLNVSQLVLFGRVRSSSSVLAEDLLQLLIVDSL